MQQGDLTLHVEGVSRLHAIHPFNKLAYILLTGCVVYCAPGGWRPDAIILALSLGIGAMSDVLPHIWKFSLRMLLPLALFMLPIHGFLHPDNHTPLLSVHGIVLYQEGVEFAGTVLLQLAAVLTASLLFVFTTHPGDLIASLTQAGWPPFAAYLLGGPLLMLPAMRARIGIIQAAQRSRGLDSEGSLIKRARSLGPLVIPLVLGAFAEIDQRAIALELRGFTLPGKHTSLRVVNDSRLQRTLRWLLLFASLSLVVSSILL